MFVFNNCFLIFCTYLVSSIETASIHKNNDTIEIVKNDVSKVGSALENFTFDVLREIIEESNEETTTSETRRLKRSMDESMEEQVQHLCQKKCEEAHRIENRQIRELKNEVKKLQDVVRLLQDQENVIDALDKDNSTSSQRSQKQIEDGDSASKQLAKMKSDLKEVIDNLNQTKATIDLQKKKDEVLERELLTQKKEISQLKLLVEGLNRNATVSDDAEEGGANSSRSSTGDGDLSGFRRLLEVLPPANDEDLRARIINLQRILIKKKKEETLDNEMKQLEDSLKRDDVADKDLLRLIIDAMRKVQPKTRSQDIDIDELSALSDAIDRLSPRDDSSAQFQAIVDSLRRPSQQEVTINPQQLNGGVRARGYRFPASSASPRNQFFPNSLPPKQADGLGFEKPGGDQAQSADFGRQQQELLRQIEELQAAADGLNRPDSPQRPEDRAMVADLEQQIADLRSVVNGWGGGQQGFVRRTKRSDDAENFLEMQIPNTYPNITDADRREKLVNALYLKVLAMKNRLNSTTTMTARAASYPPAQPLSPPLAPLYAPDAGKDLQKSLKNDFLSDVIEKILEKIVNAIPVVVQKLFNFSLEELAKFDPQDYDLQVLSKNLGVLAYVPIILLRIFKGVGAFLTMLRKNGFFRNFLLPALVLGVVSGSVLFLIWWLQPDETSVQYGAASGGYGAVSGGEGDPNQYATSYNYPIYNKSYYNTNK